jgi:hypothetical protein
MQGKHPFYGVQAGHRLSVIEAVRRRLTNDGWHPAGRKQIDLDDILAVAANREHSWQTSSGAAAALRQQWEGYDTIDKQGCIAWEQHQ